eukprot:c20205_g1_i3.p1 GENE.c20205_g1_i3~~c20205_g1_i3.p1  ORF type:complete len:217 (-),score=35.24 c20205_g1_i3:1393-2043(-)
MDSSFMHHLVVFCWSISPMYGTDVPGSLTNQATKRIRQSQKRGEDTGVSPVLCVDDILDFNRLPSLLRRGLGGQDLAGVTTAYLYFGTWLSSFAWHAEDMNLYSINFHHYGAPKIWYSIPTQYTAQFEQLAKELFPLNAQECSAFLRHKTCVIAPHLIRARGIPVERTVQRPGELIVTMPRGYHSGFNLGFNVNEAVNFATMRWASFGLAADRCVC